MNNYIGKIQFGDKVCENWYGFNDFNHEKVQANITEVISRPEIFEGFDLYITGGILEGWLTWDIDWALIGPYNSTKIKEALEWITNIGFKHGIYPDVTYSEKLFDLNDWQKTRDCEDRWLYRTSNIFIKEGNAMDLSNYKKVEDGLYRYWSECPFDKNIKMDKKGHKYNKPIKII